MMIEILIVAMIGFALSLYAFLVEQKSKNDPTYRPACDISDAVSCTKAFRSPYGKFLSVPNSIWGMLFYGALIGPALLELQDLVFIMSIIANFASVIFAYFLYTKVKSYCLICTSIYLVNIVLLIFAYRAAF